MAKRHRDRGSGSLFKRGGRGPWICSWYSSDGRRRQRSSGTTDRATADRIVRNLVAKEALRREGIVNSSEERVAAEGRRRLEEHIADYIAHCRRGGQANRAVIQKERHLLRLAEFTDAVRLRDLTTTALGRYLDSIANDGKSARTVNFARQHAVAFMNWAVKDGRVTSNPLTTVPKADEQRDRRRIRRPLTDDELSRLLSFTRTKGRDVWYMAAAIAGLRKGDLVRLTWRDIDFDSGVITVSGGKAKRTDLLPLHPQLSEALQDRLRQHPAMPSAKVFPQAVTDRTRRRDFEKSGIPLVDDDGRVADLHALRTTLGTNLARAGVAPQVAQRVMRHSDYRTTLAHYTVLGLADTTKAINELPTIADNDSVASQMKTGTDDGVQPNCKRFPSDSVRGDAKSCDDDALSLASSGDEHGQKLLLGAGLCDSVRRDATEPDKAGERTRTVNIQLGRLTLYH